MPKLIYVYGLAPYICIHIIIYVWFGARQMGRRYISYIHTFLCIGGSAPSICTRPLMCMCGSTLYIWVGAKYIFTYTLRYMWVGAIYIYTYTDVHVWVGAIYMGRSYVYTYTHFHIYVWVGAIRVRMRLCTCVGRRYIYGLASYVGVRWRHSYVYIYL